MRKEEEKEEKEEEEQEDQGKVEMLMSQGASDLLHKPSFLSTALKISAATLPFSDIFIIGIPYSCVFFHFPTLMPIKSPNVSLIF